jgi:superoxide dismutase, Fe-Mn family
MQYTLPDLPYKFDALEPYIDALTMEIHHDKHHATYVQKLNDALTKAPEQASWKLEDILANPGKLPIEVRDMIRNNGGGHYNHSLFWTILSPKGGGGPKEPLAGRLKATFGSIDGFREIFTNVALNRFGSGWAWLALDKSGKLIVVSTQNQDTPFMENYTPVFGLDVWEHAYYLRYQNKRADYIKAFWSIIDWERINELLKEKESG